MNRQRVVITGMGTINPLAHDVETTYQKAIKGVNGIAKIKRFDTTDLGVHVAGEVKDFDFESYFGRKLMKRYDRFIQMAMIATKEAMTQANLPLETLDATRMGVYYGSGIGGLETIALEETKGQHKGYDRLSPFFIPMAIINLAAGNIAIEYGAKGMVTASVTACASATNSIGDAFRALRDGYLDVAITGGAEASITPLGLGGFKVMHALSKEQTPESACRPFDLERSGFVMGEGAGTLVLETLEHAQARGATIYGEIVGYGATCDASHITAPDPEGEGALQSMFMAVKEAGAQLNEIDYVNAHGTSTPLNDKTETMAIKRLFKDHAKDLLVSSTKSMSGHLLGASGALEAILTIKALAHGIIPPTINYHTPDPECDLDIVPNEARTKSIRYALSNSLGFGGHNATLCFKRWEGNDVT